MHIQIPSAPLGAVPKHFSHENFGGKKLREIAKFIAGCWVVLKSFHFFLGMKIGHMPTLDFQTTHSKVIWVGLGWNLVVNIPRYSIFSAGSPRLAMVGG